MLEASLIPDLVPGLPSNLSSEPWPEEFQKQYADLELELKEG